MKSALVLAILVCGIFTSNVGAANAVFTPVGSSSVSPGINVVMTISVATVTLASFDAADIIIGSNDANDVNFVYAAAWNAAFDNPSPPTFDVGFYNQDVFVGGNNGTPVGTQVVLGTVTIDTAGMTPGMYDIRIDNTLDSFSRLILAGNTEPLNGFAIFEILPPVPAVTSWGFFALALLMLIAGTNILRRIRKQSAL